MTMKIVADDKIPFLKGALEPYGTIIYKEGKSISPADVADADALIIRTRTRCDKALLEGSAVKAIFTATIGFDHIDRDYCHGAGIHWQNAPGCNAASVQQYIASALAQMHFNSSLRLRGLTIAVVGVGNVGSLVAQWAELMGMTVLRVDPLRALNEGTDHFTPYADALRAADIVTYHTPLTRSGEHATYHLFNTDTLQQLKPGAIVINTSRGEVADTQALIKGIDSGAIGAAVIDVWENEPNLNTELLQKAYITTPHIAGYSADSKRNGTAQSVRALCSHFGISTQWQPQPLPEPEQPVVSISPQCDAEDAMCHMMLHTYNIMADHNALQAAPEQFEYLRGHYAIRREIGAFALAADAPHKTYLQQFGIR